MMYCDVAIIGGGILGCFAARNLMQWNISTLLIDGADDVCTGITRANTAIVYAGYDNKPGSLKAEMTVRANQNFDTLCRELAVPFSRCGSLMVSFGPEGDRSLAKKLKRGQENGVEGLQLLSGDAARELEPMLSANVTSALYAPSTGTVNPWQLGIAAYENALQNGAKSLLGAAVTNIRRDEGGYIIETTTQSVHCKMAINCAGQHSDQIHQLLFPASVQLRLDGSDFLILDKHAQKPHHIIFQEAEDGKGITAVPCTEGNLLLDSPARPMDFPYATTQEGISFIYQMVADVLPEVDMSQVIRSFGAVRPNPYAADGRSIHDFCIEEPEPSFISLIGIKTPGLTCADELGKLLARKAAVYLKASANPDFDPCRHVSYAADDEIICQCEQISRGEILDAIRRGAKTVEAVKRRVGTGMGRCQGSRCSYQIEKILEECRHGTL